MRCSLAAALFVYCLSVAAAERLSGTHYFGFRAGLVGDRAGRPTSPSQGRDVARDEPRRSCFARFSGRGRRTRSALAARVGTWDSDGIEADGGLDKAHDIEW